MLDYALLVAVMIDSREEARIEREFRQRLETPAAVEEYNRLPATQGGKILDVDIARWLCPAYAASIEGRRRWTGATSKPASEFIKRLFAEALKREPTGLVVFLAGGGGSGKSTVAAGPLSGTLEDAEIIYDGTFGVYATARERVESALVTGRWVLIAYVHRPFEDAVKGVADRYQQTGRWVPAKVLAEDHAGSQDAILRLQKDYQGDERVGFIAWDNTSEAVQIPMDRLAQLRYDTNNAGVAATAERLYPLAREGLPYDH